MGVSRGGHVPVEDHVAVEIATVLVRLGGLGAVPFQGGGGGEDIGRCGLESRVVGAGAVLEGRAVAGVLRLVAGGDRRTGGADLGLHVRRGQEGLHLGAGADGGRARVHAPLYGVGRGVGEWGRGGGGGTGGHV